MASSAPPAAENVAHDDLCPICHLLLYSPVRTECNHLLCASCMAQWADVSTLTTIIPSPLDLNLSAFDPHYDPTPDLEAGCPMCRTLTTAALDKDFAADLERRYPATYKERREEEMEANGARIGEDGIEGLMILIGNRHRFERGVDEGPNKHDWTFFVRVSRPDIVKEVRINLHPTFRPPRVVIKKAPFEVRRLGWGTFTIEAEIVLKEQYGWVKDGVGSRSQGLKLDWMLSFEGRGQQGRVRAKVKKVEVQVVEERALRPRGQRQQLEGGPENPIDVDAMTRLHMDVEDGEEI
jgi:hypothetical protein